MNALQSKLITFVFAFSLTSSLKPFESEYYIRRAGLISGIAAILHMITKEGPDAMPYTPKKGLEDLRNTPIVSKEFLKKCWDWVNHVIIGFPGKKKGITPVGSKIFIEGMPRVHAEKKLADGTNIEIIHYESVPAYGLLGTTWSYLSPSLDALKKIKEIIEIERWFCNQI